MCNHEIMNLFVNENGQQTSCRAVLSVLHGMRACTSNHLFDHRFEFTEGKMVCLNKPENITDNRELAKGG